MMTFHSHTIIADGVALAVKRAGRGIPVVCLSAVGHDAFDFEPLAERLGHRFEFICVEWPEHGDSDRDHQPAGAARYADLIESVLWELSVRNPFVIGNSIGGAAAILYASRRPVRGLVICDAGGLVAVDATVRKFCALFAKFFAAGARGAWWFPSAFALYYRMVLSGKPAIPQRRRIIASARKIAPVLAQAWRSFGAPNADIREVAAALTAPTWIAWARNDRIIPLSRCMPAIKRIKHATLDTFAASHTPFLECPDEFAAKFEAFASGVAVVPSSSALSVAA